MYIQNSEGLYDGAENENSKQNSILTEPRLKHYTASFSPGLYFQNSEGLYERVEKENLSHSSTKTVPQPKHSTVKHRSKTVQSPTLASKSRKTDHKSKLQAVSK